MNVLSMASEAGLSVRMSGLIGGMEHLFRFAKLVAEAERQRCTDIIQREMNEQHEAEDIGWCALEYVRDEINRGATWTETNSSK